MNYKKILTNSVKEHIKISVECAKNENNKTYYIEVDKIISLFSENLTPEEYNNFDCEKAEGVLFGYGNKLFLEGKK